MKMLYFARRNALELLRDPLNLLFGLAFPLVILLLLTTIAASAPVPLFQLQSLTPGIVVFGFSFFTLFSGLLIAKDRSSSFLLRLYTAPLRARDFLFAYTLPLFPLALGQAVVCYLAALGLGLPGTLNILPALAVGLPTSFLYIGLGLLCGSLLNEKQVGGICGALLTNLTAWLSGAWFDLDLVGGAFAAIANLLPFVHAVEAGRAALAGQWARVGPELLWVLGWSLVIWFLAVWAYTNSMRRK